VGHVRKCLAPIVVMGIWMFGEEREGVIGWILFR
jgi:hypothetical protein